ncbi:hypothetical protein [Rossellomorea sp. YZS02]|uniref:hypothetical protein n=1 Tax=Rossellomorea sp. YZS02 TaxID=3097358 RepID=UPI002A181684|nr:hypothetical protein [Rossellomorea sp. YZS02]MDX8346147.1 hypothetical protein [Rossellomorea sp. YZS02]
MDIKLVVDNDGIREVDRNKLAKIYFLVDGVAFPEEEWVDFKDILPWWENALLASDSQSVLTLHFKDGPYKIKCLRSDGDQMRVEFLKETLAKDVLILKGNTTFSTFIELIRVNKR